MRDDEYDEEPPRENLMQRRLRKARGEDIPDEPDLYNPYDEEEEERPRGLGGGYQSYRRGGYGQGGGCGQGLLYLTLGAIAAMLIGSLLLNQTLGGLGSLFAGIPRVPDVSAIINTPTPQVITGAAVVQRIQQLSRLETASYTIETVIDVRQGSTIPIVGDLLAGDALLLIAHGTVVAGVDLSTLAPQAVTVSPDGQTVSIQLPPAQIFDVALDSQKTRVYSRERGLFAPENKDLETLARQQAEQQILAAACEDAILAKASLQAETALRQFLGLLDDVQVVVYTTPPGPCAPPAAPAATPSP